MKRRNTSIIILYRKDKTFSVQERGDASKCGEEYAFFGGGIEKEETPEQALIREIKEELNITLTNYEFLGAFDNEFQPGFWSKRHLFAAPYEQYENSIKVLEGKGLRMVTVEEFMKLNFFPKDKEAKPLIENFLKK